MRSSLFTYQDRLLRQLYGALARLPLYKGTTCVLARGFLRPQQRRTRAYILHISPRTSRAAPRARTSTIVVNVARNAVADRPYTDGQGGRERKRKYRARFTSARALHDAPLCHNDTR